MIKQNDTRMRWAIQHYGCYYMSLLYLANHWTNVELSAELINGGLYMMICKRGWMVSEIPLVDGGPIVHCWIADPVSILRWFGVVVGGVRKVGGDYVTRPGELEVLFYKAPGGIGHFVVGDGKGNCAYDPWYSAEGGSRAVREGVLESKRVFAR